MQNLTNALQAALLNTGVAKPMTLQHRVWLVVKEDQPCTYKHISKRIGAKGSSVSGLLSTMEKCGMVFSRGAKGAKEYSTDLDTYTLLRKPKPTSQPAPGVNIDTVHAAQTKPVVHLTRQVVDFDRLTIGEAREMYQRLKEMFG